MRFLKLPVFASVQSHPLRAGRMQLRAAFQRPTVEPQAEARAQGQRDRLSEVQTGPTGGDEHDRQRWRRPGPSGKWRRSPGSVGRKTWWCSRRGRFADERAVHLAEQQSAVPAPSGQFAGLAVGAGRAGRRRGQLQQQLQRRRPDVAAVSRSSPRPAVVQDRRRPGLLHGQLVVRHRARRFAVRRRRGNVAQVPDAVQTEHVYRRHRLRALRRRPFPLQRAQLRDAHKVRNAVQPAVVF